MNNRVEPSRLTLARRMAGLTKASLAKALKVSPGTVVLWEDGERDPTRHLEGLCRELGASAEFLLGIEVPKTNPDAITFRKRQDATRTIKYRAAAAIDLAAGVLAPAIEKEFGKLPEVDVPEMSSLGPEGAAAAMREHWNLGQNPIKNIVWQLEARGVQVFWIAEESASLSAFCKVIGSSPYIILNTNRHDGCRSRFDACHELGHLVLHRDVDLDQADVKQIEREADRFASAFLMPTETFVLSAPAVFDIDRLFALKRVWGASVQAMVRRLRDLGVFTEWQYTSAYKWMSAQGWRRRAEPLAGAMETSSIHWKLCDRLELEDKAPVEFADQLSLKKETVFEMMPVLGVRQMNLRLDAFTGELPLFSENPIQGLPYDD